MLEAQDKNNRSSEVTSPDGSIILKLEAGDRLKWSVKKNGKQIVAPSSISLNLGNGEILGDHPKIISVKEEKINSSFAAYNYKKSIIQDQYNQSTITCKGDYGIIFRVYNDGAAYRFFTKKKEEIIVKNEEANFNFTADHKAFIPYIRDLRENDIYHLAF
jgi:alpha-glucosidase